MKNMSGFWFRISPQRVEPVLIRAKMITWTGPATKLLLFVSLSLRELSELSCSWMEEEDSRDFQPKLEEDDMMDFCLERSFVSFLTELVS